MTRGNDDLPDPLRERGYGYVRAYPFGDGWVILVNAEAKTYRVVAGRSGKLSSDAPERILIAEGYKKTEDSI